jgi:hypothetical protein
MVHNGIEYIIMANGHVQEIQSKRGSHPPTGRSDVLLVFSESLY